MKTYFANLFYSMIPALISYGILYASVKKDRSRYRNCYFLIGAVLCSLPLLTNLFGSFSAYVTLILIVTVFLAVLFVPILLIGNGILMLKREGHSLGNLLSLLFGIIILVGEICSITFWAIPILMTIYHLEFSWYMGNLPQIFLLIGMSVIYVSLSFVIFMVYTLFLEVIPRKRDFDYVIIHGAGLLRGDKISKLLADRMDKAIEIYHKDPTPPILIPSGGQGGNETTAEATAMAQYLREHGIPEEHILEENQSANTFENLVNSKKMVEEREGGDYIALVTSNYHVYRALRYCRKIKLQCTGVGAHVAWYYWPSALIREYIAIHKERKQLVIFLLGWVLLILIPLILLSQG